MALSDAEVISLCVIFSILVGACLWLLCGLENTEDSGTGVYICIFIHVFFRDKSWATSTFDRYQSSSTHNSSTTASRVRVIRPGWGGASTLWQSSPREWAILKTTFNPIQWGGSDTSSGIPSWDTGNIWEKEMKLFWFLQYLVRQSKLICHFQSNYDRTSIS